MSIIPVQRWTIIPVTPPQPLLHCSTCRATRAFVSSGKIRLNANGKMLDAWLIYRCSSCDTTWNRTIFERRLVNRISRDELDALHHSDAEHVAKIVYNDAGLPRCVESGDVRVAKNPRQIPDCAEFAVVFVLPVKFNVRLDKVLARELGLSRRIIEAIIEPKAALRKPVRDGLRVVIRQAITLPC